MDNFAPKDFYVYFHRDRAGNIFYIGKGTKRRAWSLDRHVVWKRYVTQRLADQYDVEIYLDGLTETEAEDLEGSLIDKCGKQLINWINPGRDFDYDALGLFHKKRDANRRFVSETRPLETSNPSQAVERYLQALEAMREYASMTLERGIVAEMCGGPDWGDPGILDRLTICLGKLGRYDEAIAETERYFTDFPSALQLTAGKRINRRMDKLRIRVSSGDT